MELPSQFMENWCYDKPTVDGFARHYQTGEALPDVRICVCVYFMCISGYVYVNIKCVCAGGGNRSGTMD